jgi:ABC-type transporter Mla MlaB component
MKVETRNALLRIAINRLPASDTWVLEGQLAGKTADELRAVWRRNRNEQPGRKTIVDVVDVTSVDERGEQALMELINAGAEFVARGVYTKSLLENLSERCRKGPNKCGSSESH